MDESEQTRILISCVKELVALLELALLCHLKIASG
jgi:hypothetical protein